MAAPSSTSLETSIKTPYARDDVTRGGVRLSQSPASGAFPVGDVARRPAGPTPPKGSVSKEDRAPCVARRSVFNEYQWGSTTGSGAAALVPPSGQRAQPELPIRARTSSLDDIVPSLGVASAATDGGGRRVGPEAAGCPDVATHRNYAGSGLTPPPRSYPAEATVSPDAATHRSYASSGLTPPLRSYPASVEPAQSGISGASSSPIGALFLSPASGATEPRPVLRGLSPSPSTPMSRFSSGSKASAVLGAAAQQARRAG